MSINGAPGMAATVVAVDVGKNTAALSVTDAARHRLLGPVQFMMTAPAVAGVLEQVCCPAAGMPFAVAGALDRVRSSGCVRGGRPVSGCGATHFVTHRCCSTSSHDSNPAAMPPVGDTLIGPNPAIDGPSRTLRQSPPGSTEQMVRWSRGQSRRPVKHTGSLWTNAR